MRNWNSWHEMGRNIAEIRKDQNNGNMEVPRAEQVDEITYPVRMRIESLKERMELEALEREVWE